MPLEDTGNRTPTDTGMNARAQDESGNPVVIVATSEAIQDCGWEVIFAVASKKFDDGILAAAGPPPRVIVTTQDCSNG